MVGSGLTFNPILPQPHSYLSGLLSQPEVDVPLIPKLHLLGLREGEREGGWVCVGARRRKVQKCALSTNGISICTASQCTYRARLEKVHLHWLKNVTNGFQDLQSFLNILHHRHYISTYDCSHWALCC